MDAFRLAREHDGFVAQQMRKTLESDALQGSLEGCLRIENDGSRMHRLRQAGSAEESVAKETAAAEPAAAEVTPAEASAEESVAKETAAAKKSAEATVAADADASAEASTDAESADNEA